MKVNNNEINFGIRNSNSFRFCVFQTLRKNGNNTYLFMYTLDSDLRFGFCVVRNVKNDH